MRIYSFWWLVILSVLSGCSATQLEQGSADASLALAETGAYEECVKAFNAPPDVTGLSDMGQVMVLTQHETAKLVAAATGKNPCDRTSWRDVQVAEVRERNETARKGIGASGSAVEWGLSMWGLSEVSDDAFGAAGDKVGGDKAGGNIDNSTNTEISTEIAGE